MISVPPEMAPDLTYDPSVGSYRLQRTGGGGSDQHFEAATDSDAVADAKVRVRRFLDAGFNPGRPIGWEVQRPNGDGWLTFMLFVSR
jgi:hypothetical protein